MRPEDSRPPLFTLPDMSGHSVALHDFLRSHRIVLLFVPSSEEAAGAHYLQQVTAEHDQFRERDLVVLTVVTNSHLFAGHAYPKPISVLQDSGGYVSATYGATDQITFCLIGKDGGIKMARHILPSNQELFGVIDAMPMRRDEMRHPHRQGAT